MKIQDEDLTEISNNGENTLNITSETAADGQEKWATKREIPFSDRTLHDEFNPEEIHKNSPRKKKRRKRS